VSNVFARWRLPNGEEFDLLTPEEFRDLPDGIELLSIFGERVVKGRDDIDDDTRYGYVAYGVREPEPQRAEDAA
jgi:hypothetical protein